MGDLFVPLTNADLHQGANINGDLLATENDLADLRRFILDALANRIQELVFNNGALVTGQGTQNTVPITSLTGKISTFQKDVNFTFTDARYPADAGTGFMLPQSVDLSGWLMNGVAVLAADIHSAGMTNASQIQRYAFGSVVAEIKANLILQADLASWLLKFDFRAWSPNTLVTSDELNDVNLPVAAAPTFTQANYAALAPIINELTTLGATNIWLPFFRFSTAYFAMAVKS